VIDIEADTATRTVKYNGFSADCAIGRSGACDAADKREGDGRTPRGIWPIRSVLVRPDRSVTVPAHLPWRWLRLEDGWSDAPADPAYNRPVRHPHLHSAERLWRDDGLYDAILLLGHNDGPPVLGLGSAIFLHLREGNVTEGCVAVPRETMTEMLATLVPGSALHIL
jgi:L,D-peptidoglycan transpeptidase YkuD (ErfK/YbiS/YcfS/YnhG family)